MSGRQGQIAIVLILGAALLIYGGATGRLADAWRGLTGGGGSGSTAKPTEEPGDALIDGDTGNPDGSDRGIQKVSKGPQVADIQSLSTNGAMAVRGGGIL